MAYAEFSGGILIDCSIHDIDLALWFFGEKTKVKSVTAVGITAVQPDLRKHNDRDNAPGIIEFYVSLRLTLIHVLEGLNCMILSTLQIKYSANDTRAAKSPSSPVAV